MVNDPNDPIRCLAFKTMLHAGLAQVNLCGVLVDNKAVC